MIVRMTSPVNAGPEIAKRATALKQADSFARSVATAFSSTVQAGAPKETGWMVGAASKLDKSGQPGRTRYTVGPYSELGNPRRSAPRNTIRQFLEDYPQYASRASQTTKAGKPRKVRRRRPFPNAWHFLSAEAKDRLRALRRAGMYGMDGPAPRYWQAIQERQVPGRSGARGGVDFLTPAYAAAQAMATGMERTVFGR